jgi:glycosyltransferase involved in cell wall biosynthesis
MKVTIFADLKAEKRVSMDVYSDNLFKHLVKIYSAQNNFSLFRGPMYSSSISILVERVLDKSSFLGKRISRYILYTMSAKKSKNEINHITDHAFLVHFLNPKNTVVTCHDLIPLVMDRMYGRSALSPLGKKIYKYNLSGILKAKRVIAVSESTKRDLIKYLKCNEENIIVVYSGVDSRFKKEKELGDLEEIKRKYNLPDSKYLLHVGNCNWYKNIPGILHSLKMLLSKDIDIILIKVGEQFTKEQKELINELGLNERIYHLGLLSDEELILVHKLASVLIYPSLYEGFGFPVLEAMACGTPIVASKVASLPEIVDRAGLLVDPNSSKEIFEAIYGILSNNDLRVGLISQGLRRAEIFTWEKTAEQTFKIYEEVLASEHSFANLRPLHCD